MSQEPTRALVVEDDHSWQQIVTEILTDLGLAVDVTDSVEAATGARWSICR
jgi:CheY-like chemotaxis protein